MHASMEVRLRHRTKEQYSVRHLGISVMLAYLAHIIYTFCYGLLLDASDTQRRLTHAPDWITMFNKNKLTIRDLGIEVMMHTYIKETLLPKLE